MANNTITLFGAETGTEFVFKNKSIGKGGAKEVYLTVDGKYAMGKYLDTSKSREQNANLEEVLAFRRTLPSAIRQYWDRIFTWPLERLTPDNGGVAFVMPAISADFKISPSDLSDTSTRKDSLIGGEK
ncbi:MAG: hypothetical protein IJS08_02540, partial [Victivallales bacterium]|nr:hypothetical protein [Victivallales bacterium]